MRLEWIEDVLAVMDTGSLARAADRRFVTQSAFTRRIRMIEDSIGAPLFDRSRKPLEVLPAVRALEPELRDVAVRLERLRTALRNAPGGNGTTVAFACQHAITTTVSPRVVAALTEGGEVSVRVRSANRDECLMKLLSGEVDFALMYVSPDERDPAIPRAFQSVLLDRELLLPVCTPQLREAAAGPVIPIVSYPADVFLGHVFSRSLLPRLPAGISTASRAETALTLAAFRYVLAGIGVAWLPRSLVEEALGRSELCRLDDTLPAKELNLMMIWLPESRRPGIDRVRHNLLARLAPLSERLPHRPADAIQPIERAEE